ncbi:hypothetical protein [Croceicoccus naphthovorans]|uniref:Uncharacterized protein n=1 Tax=Croceicoccus naphthovorans TaxID=1348774 RepID=A0A0G3XER9_9SPHN|nr:hypothetical protein [Croceicoccus naphthovorans]AKM09089.1 hypothetical protein AB433_02505 [Croceicoccus naphthovorans]MBB3991670.1 hypothetical protein [Croceicoccus naphthovorans]
MTEDKTPPEGGNTARARAEHLLALYPDLTEEELSELIGLFRRKLAAIDQALIASDDILAPNYQRLKTEHLSKLTPRDILHACIVAAGIVGPVVAFVYFYS